MTLKRDARLTALLASAFILLCLHAAPSPAAEAPEAKAGQARASDISADPAATRAPVGPRPPRTVRVDLVGTELRGRLSADADFEFWTFNNTVPGPFLRAAKGDTLEVRYATAPDSLMVHSVDFHAVTGPGGGASVLEAAPGQERYLRAKLLRPGVYVYHCATPIMAQHIANGMYGLILVEPGGGLEEVDREFYVMQGEVYTREGYGALGNLTFSMDGLMDEKPTHFTFNGAAHALAKRDPDEDMPGPGPLRAKVGETVRIFFGVGGPNHASSFHIIGEIFDKVWLFGDLTTEPARNIQTVTVPPGGAVMVEFTVEVPGTYILVDHALSRYERGLVGHLVVEGEEAPEIFQEMEAPFER